VEVVLGRVVDVVLDDGTVEALAPGVEGATVVLVGGRLVVELIGWDVVVDGDDGRVVEVVEVVDGATVVDGVGCAITGT
jgi:hypothetical protein